MRNWLALGALTLAACGNPKPLDFPIGFFGVENPDAVSLLRSKGFNAIQTYADSPQALEPVLKRAQSLGLIALVSPRGFLSGRAPDDRGVVWYLQDEPDVNGVSHDQLVELERRVKTWSPGSITAFVVGDGHKAKDYPAVADRIMVDWYPVPHLPLESAGDHVRWTVEAAGGRRVWAVLQAMDWRDFPQRDPHKPRIGRFPDMAEIRFMSYDAVLQGARGVWYFTYTFAPGKTLGQFPELLYAVASPAREIAEMAPIIARGREIPLPFGVGTSGVTAKAWTYRGRDYVVVANRNKDFMVRMPDALLQPHWRPLFEVRRDPRELLVRMGETAWYLSPYQVMVFESRVWPF